jgi:hypothetical protein
MLRASFVDPRRCLVPPGSRPGHPALVRACAETFVRQNGYTATRPRDTTLMVREPFEVGSWDYLLERRRYLIQPTAVEAACEGGKCMAFFLRSIPNSGCLDVTMSDRYEDLSFEAPAPSELVRRDGSRRC